VKSARRARPSTNESSLQEPQRHPGGLGLEDNSMPVAVPSGSGAASLGFAHKCHEEWDGELTGCHLGCACSWYSSCFPKYGVIAGGAKAPFGHNVGVCDIAVPVIVLISTAICTVSFVVIFCARAYLLDWYAEIEMRKLAQHYDSLAYEGESGTGSEASNLDAASGKSGVAEQGNQVAQRSDEIVKEADPPPPPPPAAAQLAGNGGRGEAELRPAPGG